MTAYGQVQGVFFRAATRDEARRLGLTGWAENRPDGSVRAEAQGSPGAIDELIAFIRGGPGQAWVEELSVADVAAVDGEEAFSVR